jgi:hypothetical protein
MPYIVTTKRRTLAQPAGRWYAEPVSRRAVATLEEARDSIYSLCAEKDVDDERIADDIDHLPDSGGTVGPLPDGTVIEVEQVKWSAFEGPEWSPFLPDQEPPDFIKAEILDAYNARQA